MDEEHSNKVAKSTPSVTKPAMRWEWTIDRDQMFVRLMQTHNYLGIKWKERGALWETITQAMQAKYPAVTKRHISERLGALISRYQRKKDAAGGGLLPLETEAVTEVDSYIAKVIAVCSPPPLLSLLYLIRIAV